MLVGTDLFVMELGEGSAVAAPAAPAAVEESAPPASTTTESAEGRVPLIKFLGKRSLLEHTPAPASAAVPAPSFAPPAGGFSDLDDLPPLALRLPMSEEEIECIRLGGIME